MAYLDTWLQANPAQRSTVQPAHAPAFYKMQTRLIALYGDTIAAHHTFDAQIKKNHGNICGYYGKGLLLAREGKRREAIVSLKEALQLSPLDVDILRDLGKTHFQVGDYNKALKALEGALAFKPGDPEGRFLLGRAQMEVGHLENALETFKRLLHTVPDYPQGTYYLGKTYGRLGNLSEAHYHLGMYYKEKEDIQNARFHLHRALTLFAKDPARQEVIRGVLKDLSEYQGPDRNEKNTW